MRKINYGNKRGQTQNKQLQDLKQGDQICGAVLDTFSDDYLSYINHLVKNTKNSQTPVRNRREKEQEYHSSDTQHEQIPSSVHNKQSIAGQVKQYGLESKQRHHSQSGVKAGVYQAERDGGKIIGKESNNYPKGSPGAKQKEYLGKDEAFVQNVHRSKRKKMQIVNNQSFLKNGQKTISFTRNQQKQNPFKLKQSKYIEEPQQSKHKNKPKQKQHYLIQQQYQDESDNEEPSFSIAKSKQQDEQSQRQSQPRFITNINEYLFNLEANPSLKTQKQQRKSTSKNSIERLMRKQRKIQRAIYEQQPYEIEELLKENMKLKKKVKSYQQKIEELEDDVSSHLIQCKGRDKNYRGKISDLIKALTQAVSKVNSQKGQITTMKNLLRSFGQQAKKIQHQNQDESEEYEEDISESIIKFMGPQRHTSQLRTKHKKALQATMPKHQDQRKYWRQ